MGFAEAIVSVVVGWVTIYHQRSLPKLSHHPQASPPVRPSQPIILWVIAVILPTLGLAWVISQQIPLPITVITIAFLLCVWIAQNPNLTSNQDFADPEPILSSQQEKQLKECFLSGLYQLRAIEYHRYAENGSNQQLIYCRGHLRSRNYKYVYDTISQNIQNTFGDRFLCQLQAKPLENIGTDFGDQDISLTDDPDLDQALRYSFYLIPNPTPPIPPNPSRPRQAKQRIDTLINILSVALTSLTLLMVGANQRIDQFSLSQLQDGLPYIFGITVVMLSRAIARYAIARHHHIRLPYKLCFASVLPCLGGFGYLGELSPDLAQISQSGINHHNQRRILFDLTTVPSFVSLGISIALILIGHWVSPITNVTIEPANVAFIPALSSLSINNSIFAALWHSLIRVFTASNFFGEPAVTVLSPLALAGFVAMSMSALQLLPLNRLDGEYLAIAMGNHHQIQKIARLTRLIILAIALFAQPWLRLYSLLLFLLPTPRPLIRNEGLELDKTRDLVGFILIAIALLILIPVPRFLISRF